MRYHRSIKPGVAGLRILWCVSWSNDKLSFADLHEHELNSADWDSVKNGLDQRDLIYLD